MGRHGGGSRSGGSRSGGGSRSRSGSRSGGSSGRKTSSKPFKGAYLRCYKRRGRYINIYTDDPTYGTKSGWNIGIIIALIFVTFHMLTMCGSMLLASINFGGKVHGDKDFIMIEDTIDILSDREEQQVFKLFEKIYNKTGMPVMLYTDDFKYEQVFDRIENYSEDLYYKRTLDEDCMIVLFTYEETDLENDNYDWKYDFYCGDLTTKCLSDESFDLLIRNFQKKMYGNNLVDALEYSWNSVYDDLAKTTFDKTMIPVFIILPCFYSIFYIVILSIVHKNNAVYKYYKEHPEQLSMQPYDAYNEYYNLYDYKPQFTVMNCPNCGANVTSDDKKCRYCDTKLY